MAQHRGTFVSYLRVSTKRQGLSGLGLEAQRQADAHFLLGLQKAGVKFVAADMPEANELTIGIMAVVAQAERKMISARTKAALAVAKANGKKLGNPNGAASLRAA